MSPMFQPTAWLLGAAVIVGLGACAPVPPPKADRAMYEWHDDYGPGEVAITIQLTAQLAEITRGGRPIGWTYVATGKEGHDTRPGSYRITEKLVDKVSSHYGWTEDGFGNMVNPDAEASDRVPPGEVYVPAPMPFWMRLTAYGIGMHSGVIPEPGQPASHGCIRLPKGLAPVLFEAVQVGTPVTIVP